MDGVKLPVTLCSEEMIQGLARDFVEENWGTASPADGKEHANRAVRCCGHWTNEFFNYNPLTSFQNLNFELNASARTDIEALLHIAGVSQNAKQLNIILHLKESQAWPSNQSPNPCTSDPETPQPSIPQVCIKCQLTIRRRRLPHLPRRSILAGCALCPTKNLRPTNDLAIQSIITSTVQDCIQILRYTRHEGQARMAVVSYREHFGAAQGFCTREFAADQGRHRKNVTNVMQEGPEIQ